MSQARIVSLALLVALAWPGSASAHRLKLFVTVEDGALSGYAFFVGGGRPEDVDFIVKKDGGEVFRGKTDSQGNFRWKPNAPANYSVTVDAGDGHWAEGAISADRLGGVAPPPASSEAPPPSAQAAQPDKTCAPADPAILAKLVEAQVDRAVSRQLRPLMEAYDQAEGRVRFNDVMGGVGMIVGLAGAGMWALARRRERNNGE
jgi:nickel transport protein